MFEFELMDWKLALEKLIWIVKTFEQILLDGILHYEKYGLLVKRTSSN